MALFLAWQHCVVVWFCSGVGLRENTEKYGEEDWRVNIYARTNKAPLYTAAFYSQ
jgi:hypothetical protein